MKLFYRKLGEKGDSIIILHGLYGASDNWISIGKELSYQFQIYLVDLRNHGKSPHDNKHRYKDLVKDVLLFITENKIQKPILIGHSMGGKIAMLLSLQNPSLINKLIVIDIAPKNYQLNSIQIEKHKTIIKTMLELKLSSFINRKDITTELKKSLLPLRTQQLILKNIKRTTNGFQWKINLKSIQNHLTDILAGFENTDSLKFYKDTLFIKAENSYYIQNQDVKKINLLFPFAIIKEVLNTGHWIHIEQSKKLISEIILFLKR